MNFEGTSRGPLRVLIVRVGAMGDVLHGLPAVAALRERMPDCFIGWAVEPRWKALLAAEGVTGRGGMPVVDRIHEVPTREWKRRPFSVATLREIAALRREMRAERYDVCVDLQGSIRSAAIGRMAGARRFVGAKEPREWVAREFYGERVEVMAEHVIGQGCEMVGAGVGERLEAQRVLLPVDEAAERWAEKEVSNPTITSGLRPSVIMRHPGFVLLAPGGGWGAKQWPAGKHGELARELRGAGWRVLVNGGTDGEKVAEIAGAGGAEVVACTVAELIALTRRAALVIGGDTGPVHLAAALGRPVVALFGPTDPRRNGPYFPGATLTVLRHEASTLSHERVNETEAGLARIGVEEVLTAALRMLEREPNG